MSFYSYYVPFAAKFGLFTKAMSFRVPRVNEEGSPIFIPKRKKKKSYKGKRK